MQRNLSIEKSWRKYPKEKRLLMPEKLGFSPSDIKRIRKIKDPERRLIASAKLQFELFNNIHSDITAWIAGYCSESVIRQKFGSAKKLLNRFRCSVLVILIRIFLNHGLI
ncbi:hypothetical protein K8R33_02100 [archaeon]|nr:hypothetical protein [archaeon]